MDYYLSGQSDLGKRLIISPITTEMAVANKISRNDSLGYYLYQKEEGSDDAEASILAKLPSEDAAFALGHMLGLS